MIRILLFLAAALIFTGCASTSQQMAQKEDDSVKWKENNGVPIYDPKLMGELPKEKPVEVAPPPPPPAEIQPEPVQVQTPPPAPDYILYRVRVGNYSTWKEALAARKKFIKMGYEDAFVVKGTKYKVQIGAFKIQNNANNRNSDAQSGGYRSRVLEFQASQLEEGLKKKIFGID